LITDYVAYQRANARIAIANTKTRWQIRGSGKKLYRQKGTGSARVGDKKSPIRRWGWVAFGPSLERNYAKSMNKKARKRALMWLVVLKAKNGEMIGVEWFSYDSPKTKNAIATLDAIKKRDEKILLLLSEKNEIIEKSFANIPKVKCILVSYCNPIDMLHADSVVCTEGVVDYLNAL
jgi:large subunit ribosomal protein L4